MTQDEEKYRQLIERCADGIFLVRNHLIVGSNRAALKMFFASGQSPDGRALDDVLKTSDDGLSEPIALDCCPATFQRLLVLPDGNVIDAEITVSPYIDAGTPDGRLVVIRDVSAGNRIAEALSQQDKYLRLITDTAPAMIAYIDAQERHRFVNAAYQHWFKRSRDDIVGASTKEILGEDYPHMQAYIAQALRGEPVQFEVALDGPQGERRLLAVYSPDLQPDGSVAGFSAMVTDITDRIDTEEQLHRRELEFKTLVENSPDIISRLDRRMRHLYVNPAVAKLAALPPEAYIGKTKAELGLPASMVQAWNEAAEAAFATGSEQRLDFTVESDTETRFFSGRIIPETDRWSGIDSVVGIAYDVTTRARMEKERDDLLNRERSARIQAETAARARDEFLSIVSHELRAPLNGIQSWAHVLESYVKDVAAVPLAQRALQGIKTGINQQVRLIEDLLDVTRMMSGKFRLVKQPLALLPALQAAVESIRAMAAAKHITVSCDYRITSEQIEGDEDRVQQIFCNLFSNAVKFTPDGGHIWLAATHAGEQICVTVRDDGAGISPEFLPHLFNRFSQEDTSSTRHHSGLGLGLFLVRHLVELHKGEVKADSDGEGKGTTFSVYFRLRSRNDQYLTVGPGDATAGNMPLPSLEGRCVLFIDDQAEARESLTMVLNGAGARVFSAATADDAITWLTGLQADHYPDVLISDIAMPGEDGYAVLRRIRTWRSSSGATPLQRLPALALTAFAQREDRIRALTAGFQMHLTKPVAPEELIIVIDTIASRH
ncbi:PAS domain-containing protein [Noviherbaspirillum saxi]|nr:PAS domain-containing protein [Noviherbaspirillum saxi]